MTLRPLTARYATPPPMVDFCWLETDYFIPKEGETVLFAWPRKKGFTFRTGRFLRGRWRLSCDAEPRQKPVFFSSLHERSNRS